MNVRKIEKGEPQCSLLFGLNMTASFYLAEGEPPHPFLAAGGGIFLPRKKMEENEKVGGGGAY